MGNVQVLDAMPATQKQLYLRQSQLPALYGEGHAGLLAPQQHQQIMYPAGVMRNK